MRTDKCRLKTSLQSLVAEESDMCECGQKETINHVVLDCRQWNAERQELRTALKDRSRWDDMSYLLGGWSGQKDSKQKIIDGDAATWRPELAVVRATIDFAIKQGDSARAARVTV